MMTVRHRHLKDKGCSLLIPFAWDRVQIGVRGRQEHHRMRLEDFRIVEGDDESSWHLKMRALSREDPGK